MQDDLAPPWPLVQVTVAPKLEVDRERLAAALVALGAEDPRLAVFTDRESGQTVLAGLSEAHLDLRIEALQRRCELEVGAPQVAYRETLGRRGEIEHCHRARIDGALQVARIRMVFEPGASGSGFVFDCTVGADLLPAACVAGVVRGLEAAKEDGLLAGFPVIDFKATLIDAAWDDADASPPALEAAARAAFMELRKLGSPELLEPIMAIEVRAPADRLASVLADLKGRRGEIKGQSGQAGMAVIHAFAPLANLFGYANTLRAMSEGRGEFVLSFDRYAPIELSNAPLPPFPPAMAMRA